MSTRAARLLQLLDELHRRRTPVRGAFLAERMGVHRNTLAKRLTTDRDFPRPGRDGKWLLSEVIEWEQRQS